MAGAVFAAAFAAVAWRPAWVVRFPRVVLLAIAGASLLALHPLVEWNPPGLRLRIDPSTEPLLPAGDPAQEVYRQAVRNFGDDEVFVIAMESEDVFRAETLAALRRVTDGIAQFPEVRKVQSLTDVVAFRYDAGNDWIEVADFLDEIPTDPGELEAHRQRALADPLYQKVLISDDGRTAAINVTFRKMTDQQFIDSRMDERIREVLDAETGDGVRFHVAGRSHTKVSVYRLMLRDMRRLIPLAFAVVAAGLWLVFGSWRAVVLPDGGDPALRPLDLRSDGASGASADGADHPAGSHAGRDRERLRSPHGVALPGGGGRALPTGRMPRCSVCEHMRLPVLVAGLTTMIGFGALSDHGRSGGIRGGRLLRAGRCVHHAAHRSRCSRRRWRGSRSDPATRSRRER